MRTWQRLWWMEWTSRVPTWKVKRALLTPSLGTIGSKQSPLHKHMLCLTWLWSFWTRIKSRLFTLYCLLCFRLPWHSSKCILHLPNPKDCHWALNVTAIPCVTGAILENAVITGANFQDADLTDVNFEDTLVRYLRNCMSPSSLICCIPIPSFLCWVQNNISVLWTIPESRLNQWFP